MTDIEDDVDDDDLDADELGIYREKDGLDERKCSLYRGI